MKKHEKEILDIVQGLMDVIKAEQGLREAMQREIYALRYRVHSLETQRVLVEMPRLAEAIAAQDANVCAGN